MNYLQKDLHDKIKNVNISNRRKRIYKKQRPSFHTLTLLQIFLFLMILNYFPRKDKPANFLLKSLTLLLD